ncbi:unnamed protein product [Parnassius apollo]|uniref:(apollo) hypothetical protein n=1 Tax=Parnassius apollo TaxID=110799 RepID=A0A8S3WD18_PARAO|nr:unnamed protein product [Parnassius apollo]
MDIENMLVILREDLREELSDCVPAPASGVIITAEDFNDGNDDRLSDNSQEVLHVIPENKNIKQNRMVYTDAEIAKFLTEFDTSDV